MRGYGYGSKRDDRHVKRKEERKNEKNPSVSFKRIF